MKFLVKVQFAAIAFLFTLSSVAYGIGTLTVDPTELPKGAYANGADGQQVFIQTIYVSLTGGWAGADFFEIQLPPDVTIANIDEDVDYDDEIIFGYDPAGITTYSIVGASTNATTIRVLSSAAAVAGDQIWVTIPVETSASPAVSSDDYTITFDAVSVLVEGGPYTRTVNYVDLPDLVTWSAEFEDAGASGLVESDDRGRYFPEDAAVSGPGPSTVVGVTSLPNYIDDAATTTLALVVANVTEWAPTIAAQGVAGDANDNNDIEYFLWISQSDSISKITTGNAQRVIDVDPTLVLDPKTYPVGFDNLDFNQAAHTGHFYSTILDEGDWYVYVTSDVTGDWPLGRSDTLRIHHKPVFADYYDATLGTGLIFDDEQVATDFDDIFSTGGAGDDGSLASITLESGGVIGILNTYSPTTNEKDISIFWFVEDIDDNAEVHMFRSTNAALGLSDIDITVVDGKDVVTSLDGGNAVKIHPTDLFEEDDDGLFNYTTFTSEVVFEPAGTFYIYVVLNDSNSQAIKAVDTEAVASAGAPVAATLTIKHFPFFGWHFYNEAVAGGAPPDWDINLESDKDRYVTLSWGNPPTGSTNKDGDTDLDAAGTATVTVYAVTLATGTFALITGGAGSEIDDVNLISGVSGGTAFVLATITDSVDTPEANRFEWDFRNSGRAEARYYIWGVMEHDGDKILAQFNENGTAAPAADADDIEFNLTHGSYMRAITPYSGPPVELDNGDSYRLVWESFDLNSTGSPAVFAALVKVGADNPGNASMVLWANTAPYDASADIAWVLPVSTAGADPATAEVGATAADGSVVINISSLTNTAAGPGAPTEGDYEVYYFFDADEDADGDWVTNPPNGVKAHGTLYLSAQTTAAYNIQLTPNKASMSPGDTLNVDIFAISDGTNANMAIFFVKIPQSALFTIVDQDGDPNNGVVQPFDNLIGVTTVAPNELLGDVLMNSLEVVDGSYLLGYLEKLPVGDAPLAATNNMVSFQIVMSSAIATPIEDLDIIFSESDGFVTNLHDLDGSPQSTSIPPVALGMRLGQAGILFGAMDVEGRVDQGEEVSFYLTEAGSFTPSTDQAYLDANGDADGTDGVQLTLGASGFYELKGIPSGEYDVMVRKSGYLDVIRPNERIVSMDNTPMNFTGGNKLYGGDAAGYDDDGDANTASLPDNRVDGDDTNAIAAAFGTSSGDSLWNVFADVDESGEVGINDLFMASKNLGRDGDGVFYREIPGSNQDAIIYLAVVDETAEGITFAVQAENLANLSAYSVDMLVPTGDWELVSYSDGLASHFETIQASRINGSAVLYGSAVRGYATLAETNVELMSITLRQRSIKPDMPTLSEVTLVSGDGTLTKALIGGMRDAVPAEFALSQNYPNPFNPTTTINFALPIAGQVQLMVYNLLGQEVRTLVTGTALEPGNYKAVWNSLDNQGRKVSSGVYFYHLVVNNKVIGTKKMVLLK